MIEVQAAWNRPCRSLTGAEKRVLLVRVIPGAGLQGEPCHVCLLLDTSTSMEGERLEAAKHACCVLWERMRKDDRLCMVRFDTSIEPLIPWTAGHAMTVAQLRGKLTPVVARGVTLLHRAISRGAAMLQAAGKGGPRFLLIVTDGHPTDRQGHPLEDLAPLLELAGGLAAQGITVLAVGLGDAADYNAAFLTDLSDRGRGQFCYSPQAQDLAGILERSLHRAQRTTATSGRLTLRLSQGHLNWVARILPDYSPLDLPSPSPARCWAVPVGAIQQPETAYLFEVQTEGTLGTPPGEKVVGSVTLSAVVRGSQKNFNPVDLRLHFEGSLLEQQRVNQEVEHLRLLAEMNRIQDQLRQGAAEGLALTEKLVEYSRITGNLQKAAEYEEQARILREKGEIPPDMVARASTGIRATGDLLQAHRDRPKGLAGRARGAARG